MDKDLAISQLSSIVFYVLSLLLGLHFAYLVAFFLNKNSLVHSETISLFYFNTSYSFSASETEYIHMREVGNLFIFSHMLVLLFLVFGTFLFWFLRKSSVRISLSFHILPGICTAILLISTFFFTRSFELFHKILFRNNYWIFPPNSLILQAYPISFFIVEFILLVLTSIGIYLGIYRFLKKKPLQ